MMSWINDKKPFLILGACVFVIGLLWNFPLGKFQHGFTKSIQKQTGIVIQSERIAFAFPLGLHLTQVKVLNVPMGQFLYDYQFDSATFTLSPLSALTFLMKNQGAIKFNVTQKGGRIWGTARLKGAQAALVLDAKRMSIDDTLEFPPAFEGADPTRVPVKGTFDVNANLSATLADLQAGKLSSLSGEVSAKASAVNVIAPLVGAFDFSKMSAQAKIDKSQVNLNQLTWAGPQISGKASGTVILKDFVEESDLKLDAQITFGEKGDSLKSMVSTLGAMKGLKVDDSGALSLRVFGPLYGPDVASGSSAP